MSYSTGVAAGDQRNISLLEQFITFPSASTIFLKGLAVTEQNILPLLAKLMYFWKIFNLIAVVANLQAVVVIKHHLLLRKHSLTSWCSYTKKCAIL